jgi:ElaB/YqjD/DUF883 family membrane-anchored ribosome-binding protein
MNTDLSSAGTVSTEGSSKKLMDDLRVVVSDAEELLRATASQAGEKAAAARARLQESLHIAKEKLDAAETAVMEKTRQAARATDHYVHENPWKAIGVAACVGVIVGMLIARR